MNALTDICKRAIKEHKFYLKIQKLVIDTEDKPKNQQLSLADCWRWIKGLLQDFVALKH